MVKTAAARTLVDGRYEVGPVLGAGGMGTVHDGVDRRLERPVAIKLLRPDLAADPGIRARFTKEACAAAQVAHPNVVAVFDSGEDDGVPYIVMERLSGRTLRDEIDEGPLDPARARELLAGALAGLAAAHACGVLHRDVKPANVLLAADGSAKVADFGIAKVAEDADATAVTVAGTIIGTPSYLAPERLRGEPATAASDVYAAGVVLYEALTGRQPFPGDDPTAVAQAVLHEEPTPLLDARPEAGADLAVAVTRAMAKDPTARFPSAAAMASALVDPPADRDATIAIAPVNTTAVLPIAAIPATRRRRARLAPAIVAALIVAAVLTAALALGGRSSSDAGETPTTAVAPTTAIATTATATVPVTSETVATTKPAGKDHTPKGDPKGKDG